MRGFDGWGIEDEIRITDEAGNARALSHAMRVFDAAAHHWTTTTLDVYRATVTTSTAEWKGGQMTTTSRGTDADGQRYITRTRYYDIKPGSFRFQQDRSVDDGKTWDEGVLKIDAKRVAAVAPR